MEDNLRSIYDKLVSSGSTGTYDEFVSFFNENDQNKKSVYDKLMTLGSKGTYDEFLAYAGAGQQPAPGRVDVSDVQQAEQGNTTETETTEIPTVTMDQVEQQPNSTTAPGSDGHFLGNISVGADGQPKPMEENPLRNPDNQPAEERTIPEIEVQKQKVDEVSQALSEATRQRNEQRAQQQRERDEEIGFWGRLAKGLQAAENPITPEVVEVITNPTDNDLRAAQNEVRNAKKQLQLEEMRQNGEMKGLAFIRGIETANYYDLIPVLGTADAMSILSLSQALKEGKELTESQQLLLQAMEARAGVDFNYKDNNTIWERVGQSTPEQLMFTLQFVFGAGLTGATEAGERIAAKEAQKAAIRYAKKGVNSGARRFIGGTVIPKLEGMAVSSTIQTFANPLSLANMAEDFERRYAGDIYYDNDGNLHVFDNDRSAGQAAYQAVASAWIENFTEYSGQNITKSIRLADGKMFDLAGKFDNVMKNVGGGRIKDVFTVPQKLSHLTQIGSAPEEFLEEELGSVMNALFATDAQRGESYGDAFKRTISQSFSGEQQLETLLSVTITSTLLGGGGNAVNAVGNAGYRREVNREVERSKALLGKVQGIDIAELDNQIENGQISDIASYLKEQSDANGWSQDEQGAAVSYVLNRARQIGIKHNDDIAIEEAQQEMRQQAEDMANRWDGNIYNATWKDNEGNEQPVTIINGRIHYTTRENGTIHFNPYTSSGMIAIRLADGTKKQVPSRTITGIQSVMSVDEQLEAQGNTIPQMMQAQFEQEGMAIPTVESVWGGNLVANETQFENGKYTYLGQDQNGLYAFANNDKKTQKDNPIIYMTERQLVEYGLSLNIQAANATGDAETAQQAQDDLDFMHHLDELTADATEKDQWDVLKAYASQYVGYDENGSITPESNPKAYAPYLLASSEGSFENAIASIDESIAAWASEVQQQSQAADISGDAAMNAETHANMDRVDGRAAGMVDFYTNVRNILLEMQQGQQEAIEESLNEMPVSQMEVGQEFPVMYDGQQAVAVVVGKDADGRNVLTIRDQEGNDLESGIDDWTDEQWERFKLRPEEVAMPSQQTEQQESAEIEQKPTEIEQNAPEIEQKEPENEQQEEVSVSPAQQTFDGLVQKYGDKAGHKIDVTAEDKSKTLDKAKKALEKAQTDYDDAPIGKEEKAEAALQKAQEEYNTALAEKQEWDEVKAVKDRFVAERLAAQQAADEERHAQAVAEEEARRAEEERKAREREATGANNVAPNIREKWEGAQRVEGNADEITLANGERIAGHYVLVESGAASASHDALNGFAKTEGFPLDENEQSVNDRDYERDQNAQQITRQIAAEYDSRALQQPVVVSQDGVVLSGNGRTMAGEIAAAQNTDGAYIDYLKKYAPKYGFTPEQVEGMAHPRVVFVPDASMPYTAETFAKFNQQEMKGQNKTEQAVKLGKLVDDATFGRIIRSINRFDTLGDFYADTKATAEAIGELLKAGAINQMQHTEMFDGDAISAQGREILENMLIGKAFESNPDAVRQLAAYKSLRQSVITALAEISNNIALGEYSLESELSDAIALAYNARKNGYKAGDAVSEFARQGKLFETEEDATAADYTNATVLMLADVMNDNRVTRLKKVLSIYNQQAEQSAAGQTDLFAEGVKTQQDILNEVLLLLQHGTESEQQQALDAAVEQRKAAANEEVDTNPTEAQKEAGNYKKGHVTIDGFDISIENPAGSTRSGTDAQGNPWSVTMHNSYGYIRMTEGVDGDHIDIFLSDHIDDWNGTVYVVDQVNEDGSFDEHKVMYGFNSAEEAREAYLSNYSEGWQGLGTITGVSREEFKKWVDSSHRKTKAFADYKSVQTTEGQSEQSEAQRADELFDSVNVGDVFVNDKGLSFTIDRKVDGKTSDTRALRIQWEQQVQDGQNGRGVEIFNTLKFLKYVEDNGMRKASAAMESRTEGTEQEAANTQPTEQPTTSTYGASNKLVSQSRYEELKRRMQEKLGGQMNMGIDPEILAIGTEMAVYHIEAGARKFADFCKNMVADLGDAIRPYLKSFYNGARDLPEVDEAGYLDELTPYEEVKTFDVNGFDKGGSSFIETAQEAVKENEVAQQAEEAVEKIKEIARKGKKSAPSKKKVVSSQQSLFGEETEETKPNTQDNGLQTNDEPSPERMPADDVRHEQRSQQEQSADGERAGQESRGTESVRRGDSTESDRSVQPGLQQLTPKNTRNNHAERGTDYAPKGVDARIEANIKAIELMQQLIESGEQATPEQMAVLRQFSGWGGLGKAFQENGYGYGIDPTATSRRLRELLGDEAYEQANMSRNSAYYTPAEVIDTLWDIARAMGFKGGNVLEGSAGIGNIIGLMPTDMSQQSSIHAVEIDQTTGNILSLLYPDARVEVQGFEATQVENGSVDLAITNVPFVTGLRVNDTTGDKDLSRRFHDIHDFCIAKNIRKLREGGIGIFITSSGTLDNSAKLREWIVSEGGADVVGAFRMNNATFGGTGVTSDIIIVRKRVNGKKSPHAIDVAAISGERVAEYDTGETKKVKGQEVRVVKQLSMDYNKYFIEHPEMMAGEMQFGFERGETFRPTSKALYPTKGKDQSQMLADFVKSFEGKEWEESLLGELPEGAVNVYEELGADVKEGSLVVNKDGVLCVAQRGKAVPLEVNANKVKGHTKVECFKAYQAIKQALADVLTYQTENETDEGLQPLLDKLNRAFDGFVKTYGHLHKNTAITFLKSDVDWPSILALEKFAETGSVKGDRVQSYGKTDIFSKRVVEKEKAPEPKNVKDGIIASIYMFGRVDVPYISEHLGMSEEEVRKAIVDEGLGFENPATRQMEVTYEYLSGNVREKLQQARDNNTDGRYDANIKALEKVIPMNIPAHLIDFTIGSSWIDPKLYEEFVKERTDIDVRFTAAGGTWFMKAPNWVGAEKNRAMGVMSEMLGKRILGTQLIEAAMQNKTITVSDTRKHSDGTSETIIDKEATQACASKIDEIRQDFKDWARAKMQSDPEMSERMERVYNEMFNNYVPRQIPDDFVPQYFGGATHSIQLRSHQAKAVIRGTTQPLLLAHEVGTGKTFTLISIAMEMRRLGTAKKPMIVVQNATVGQFVESAKLLYPNAKVLTIEEADRTVEGRKNFYAKIKYNDWDMIVVPQSVFERIPDSEERQMAFVQDKIEEKLLVLEQMRDADDDGNNMIVRQAEREISQLEDQLAGLSDAIAEKRKTRDAKKEAVTRQNAEVKALEMLDRQTDDVENFDDMGIDAILVDEAHEYKHLGFATAMQRGVKGVDPSYSKKAQGVFLKTQAVLEKNNGRNVVFATGTPISNTAAEIWTFMRYLMPADTMKQYGIYYFDDFVRNFGNLQQMLEFTTSGKFKENNRFAGYVNLPELVRIWSGVADTVLTREAGGVNDKIPDMEGGKAQDIYLPQTKALRSIMKFVKGELERFEQMSGKQKKENSHIPLVMYGIAKAAAVDARLVDETAEDDPNSKTNEAVRQTLRSLEETKDYRGTVAIFADNYQNKVSGFNIYEDIRKKLIEAGVPEEQIVVMKSGMSVKKKLEIFDKMNRGEVRVMLGSTFTLGTGVNIQERLHTLIHLDAPNRPMDYTQRNGRILRQGNLHKQMGKPVRVLRFGVEDSLDVTAYQRLKTKGAIADSIMNGKAMMANSMENRVLEEEEDVFGDTVAQLSGSEYAMLKNQAEKDVRKYQAKQKQWEADQTYVHNQIPRLQGSIKAAQRRLEEEKGYLEKISAIPEHPTITIGKYTFKSLEEMADFIKEYNAELKQDEAYVRGNMSNGEKKERTLTVNVGGIDFKIHLVMSLETVRKGTTLSSVVKREMTYECPALGLENVPVHQMLLRNALDDILTDVVTGNDCRGNIESAERIIERDSHELEQLKARDGKPFEWEKELQQARERLEEYTAAMKKEMEEKEAKYAEMDSEVEAATGLVEAEEAEEEETPDLSIREEEPPVRTGIGYKVFVLKDGKLYPPMVANPNGEATPVGVWLDADAAPIAGESKTGRPQVKAGGKGTQGGSGQLAYRPGWHLGVIPYAIQFNRKDENGEKTLFPKDFVWAEVEYADDVDYQQEAESYGVTENGKYRHSYAGLPRVPKDGSYTYRTNPNPETDPWIITGAMKVRRILTPSEVDAMVREAGREPQRREEGAITDEEVNHLNGKADNAQQIAFNAVMDALGNAGIEVVMATQEDVEKLKASIRSIQDSKGTVRGWVGNDGRIYLTSEGMNAETPIHEYTHLWAEALQMENPELWEQIKGLLKDTPEWKRIASSKGYKHIRRNEDRLAGEVLAHISGKKNAERMEAEAKRMIDEAPTLEEAAKAANLLGRMRDALKKFWTWVGKTLLGKKGNINIDQVSNMVLADLTNGVDPFHPRGGKRTNRTKRTDASIESEQNGPNDIERVNQKFNDELQQQMEGTLPSGHVYDMGMPSAYLRSTGIPNLPIRLQSSILNKKSDDPLHPYKLEEVKDLVKLIQKPLAIFAYGDKTKAQNLMIGISQPTAEGKQFLVGLALNPDVKGKTLEINSVRNVFPKNYHDWIHWIIQGKMLRVDDRESIKAIIDALRINPVDYISDNDLDSAANIVENFENPQVEGENFSDVDLSIVGPDNQIAEEYNRMTGYNSDDVSGYVRGKEELLRSFFDGLRPLEQMQQLVEKALGRKLRDSENAYGLATLLPSLNKAMMDKAETEFMLPVLRQSANMMRRLIGRRGHRKMSREEAREMLNNYLLAKHGLERNEWFYQQALANDPDAEEEDKAGLRGLAESLGENPDDYKAVAEQVVADFEDEFDGSEIDAYWASMKALTDRMLEVSYESGMIGKDAFESLKARHQYYVPLRGFADGTSGDLFDYVSRHPHFQSVFKKMKGRKSKADDPLANLYNMLQSAIVIGNQNKVMQNIYNLAVNAKSDLLRVNRSWYVYNDATDEWEERFPDIPEDATADEIDAIMKQFDADMQQLKQQGKAEQYLNKMNLGKRVLSYQAKEHEMTAYINGRKVMMHVAGNPLVAQQLNKSNTQQLGWFAETVQSLTRFASRINTSLSPAFMFTNAARDIGFSLYSATVTGGLKKNLQMVGNLFRAGWVLPRLILTGKMGGGITKMFSPTEAAKIEQWWNEFLDNGGETGFTNTLSAEKAKGQVDDMIRRMINYRSKDGQLRLKKATLGVIETMGRYSEDISRFAAYCLKRAEGETVKASVNEAKNVTVNFNVKGGGNSMVARFVAGCRSCYSFFNASLQGINRMGRLAKENPKAFAACLMACVVQGAMLPWLNMALFAMLGGDDDDWEKYEMLSEYTANHNLIIFVGNHKFLKIPYSQELAPFAAMGNIWFRQQMGWNHGRSIASQIGNMFLDLSPVNIGESKTTWGKLAKTITPTIAMPLTEWALNENFTASPIEKRYEWNKFDSGWEKAYESRTSKWLIDATRYLDEKTNGTIDINPSFVEHIATGMLGGIGRSGDNLMKYFSDGFQTQNAPYLRTIMFDSKQQGYIGAVSREYGRLAYEVLPEVKHDVDRADMLEFARLANTQDYQIANVVSIYKTGKDLLGNKTSFQGIDKLEKAFKKAQKESDGSESANEYLQAMRDQINEMKMEMLDAIDEVIYNNSGAGRRSRIDRVREIERDSKEKYQREHSEE